jgi:hypothetical protein
VGEVKTRNPALAWGSGAGGGAILDLSFAFCHLSLLTALTRAERILGYMLIGGYGKASTLGLQVVSLGQLSGQQWRGN